MRKWMIVHQPELDVSVLREYLGRIADITITGITHTLPTAWEQVTADSCDVLITTPELLKSYTPVLPESVLVVCIGSHETLFASPVSRNIFAYLYPPFSYERVLSLIQNIESYMLQLSHPVRKDYVFVKSEYKLIKVTLSDILFLSGMRDYTQVYLRNRTSPLITLQNLKDFEARLPEDTFIRVHRSYIISIDHVDAISRNEISIDTHIIPIGNAYRELLDDMIGRNS